MQSIEMPPADDHPQAGVRSSRVFLSYARVDSVFAQDLRDRLIQDGFDAYLDVQDIVKGEPWQERLQNLIVSADAILFLISPASVKSENCDWEINEAERLAKRILPVVALPTPLDDVPSRLHRLNFAFLDTPVSAVTEYRRLLDALRQDALWMREHTRLLELATRWMAAGKPRRMLLQGRDIDACETWRDNRIPSAPALSALHTAYLSASRHHASEVLRYWIAGLAGVMLSVSVLAFIAIGQRNTAVSIALALRSDAVREADPEMALKLALKAYEKKQTPDALGALRRSIDQTIQVRVRRGATRFKALGGGLMAQWGRSHDGTRIVIGQAPDALLVLDGETLDENSRLDLGKTNPTAIAISAHGRYVASVDGSPRVSLWSAGAGPKARQIDAPHDVRGILIGPAETRLALIGYDEITFYSLDPLAQLGTARNSGPGAYGIDFAPDDSLVLAVGFDNQARIIDTANVVQKSAFDLKAEALRLKPFLGESKASMLARGSFLDRGRIITTGGHQFWTLWDANSGRQIAQARTLTPGTGTDWSLVNTAADLVVTEDGSSGKIFGWSLATGDLTHNFGDGHRNLIRVAALTDDARSVATLGEDGKLILWSVAEQRRLGRWSVSGQILSAGFTPSGRSLATLTAAGEVSLWDTQVIEAQGRLELKAGEQAPAFYEARFSDDANRLVWFSLNDGVAVWNAGQSKPQCVPPGVSKVTHAALSNDGRLLAIASQNGFLRFWLVGECRELSSHRGAFQHVAFNSTSTAVIANNYDDMVQIVAVNDGHLITERQISQNLTNSGVFTKDGQRFAVMGNDGTAIIADTVGGREVTRVKLPSMPFRRGVFDADSNRLFTTHDDNIIRSWDIRTGNVLAELRGSAGQVAGLRLLANDTLLLAPSDDGTARLWQTADGALVRVFEGSSEAATDAIFSRGHVTVVDIKGSVTRHRCDACLAEKDLINTARARVAHLEPMR